MNALSKSQRETLGKTIDELYLKRAVNPVNLKTLSTEDIRKALWSRGSLRYRLMSNQRKALDHVQKSKSIVWLFLCTRRWGKTDAACTWIIEQALKHPNSICRYLGPTKKHLRDFARPAFDRITADAPATCKPVYEAGNGLYRLPNGSVIILGSCDTMDDANANVGTDCIAAVCDEFGLVRSDIAAHIIKSVLIPQFATKPEGRILVVGSAPHTPAHYMAQELLPVCSNANAFVKETIDDVSHVSQESKDTMIAAVGGPKSTVARREFYCELVADDEFAVIPEFNEASASEIVKESPVPLRRDRYVSADFGFNDFTFVVFAYYDFDRAKIVIEDELVFQYKSSVQVGLTVIAKELDLWCGASGMVDKLGEFDMYTQYDEAAEFIRSQSRIYGKPDGLVMRLAETVPQMIADMQMGARCVFSPVNKFDKHAQINKLRRIILERRIEIHPRCVNLVNHLKYAVWKASKNDIDSAPGFGHFDGVPATYYLTNNIHYDRNPLMPLPAGATDETHFIPDIYKRKKVSIFKRQL